MKVNKIIIDCDPVYIVSHSNRCIPDAGTSDWRKTVMVSYFTYKNGLVIVIS